MDQSCPVHLHQATKQLAHNFCNHPFITSGFFCTASEHFHGQFIHPILLFPIICQCSNAIELPHQPMARRKLHVLASSLHFESSQERRTASRCVPRTALVQLCFCICSQVCVFHTSLHTLEHHFQILPVGARHGAEVDVSKVPFANPTKQVDVFWCDGSAPWTHADAKRHQAMDADVRVIREDPNREKVERFQIGEDPQGCSRTRAAQIQSDLFVLCDAHDVDRR
mmetsp:Transcript_6924/g.42251  ORF Transcript_6924/g.42251 Transcript_6924/m.42251 type:complete len:225 (-) Transcript_6924:2976-3650(-)